MRTLAAGIGFTEGPVWTRDGRLLVVAMSRGRVVEIDLDGGVLGSVETGGGPNGLAEGPAGEIWVAQNGGAVRASGSARPAVAGLHRIDGTAVTDFPVARAQAPNDLALGPDGRIWFTDPGPPGATADGRLCALDPGTGETEVVLAAVDYPNGLAFAGDRLYLAHTEEGRVTRHRWTGTGLVPDGPDLVLPAGGPDGLALDVEGRVYAAAPDADAILVFDDEGRFAQRLDFAEPTFPTNLCFAGPGLDVLVVTAAKGGRVLAFDRPGAAPGRPLGARAAG
ncbi:SMP-30/gluconolactonase/LRE family protein [Pseudonocardia kujensis]|uniref:SMP-30/gluconolactonase/LRE family protein n=1 Tax=Pseudonocardia kujensis TaxID=1128675 RepID=UPI001E3780C3|nr:SMP-30/gluconolactonase/LRE family protein [Pseudonocardia kujensis]MCE0764228.1 SMP-30/gluconolactonase/LRE family protein [Pseudonocardia kujensis]